MNLSALKHELAERLARRIAELYGVEHALQVAVQVEVPPRRELGDLALTTALQLAKVLKRNPRSIAQELAADWPLPAVVRELRVEGAGYLNLYLDRGAALASLLESPVISPADRDGKVVVEHTNINPNKAAHIGHLRNAVLGDVLVRSLEALGWQVETQNYIDDTGVQLADVVVGLLDLRGLDFDAVAAIPEPFDFYCWDLYSEVGRWYETEPEKKELRRSTLYGLESGEGERAEIGRLVARRVVSRHLATMARLGIRYDLLTRESEILRLHFFSKAFEKLKVTGAVRQEAEGKNAGCWVMPLSESEEFAGLEDPDKVIVRSDGTVTYVAKDIAYQLWKLGLLGLDFSYRFWGEEGVWETAPEGVSGHPSFGGASRVINVIDARQSYLQKIVRAGLEALGHREQAESSIHFAYEMVALSTATARLLGYVSAEQGESGKALEMSGRKGIGVKADDLIDRLIAAAREEIAKRNRELEDADLDRLAKDIAVAAMRFFMIKATTHRVIAFDFEEALAFEGETGPYLQYSAVRVRNIKRKLAEAGLADRVTEEEVLALPAELWQDDLWDLALSVAQIEETTGRAVDSLELSHLARHGLDLAQKFNSFYHHHPILKEEDAALRTARLAAAQVFERGLVTLADLLGLPLPERM